MITANEAAFGVWVGWTTVLLCFERIPYYCQRTYLIEFGQSIKSASADTIIYSMSCDESGVLISIIRSVKAPILTAASPMIGGESPTTPQTMVGACPFAALRPRALRQG